MPIYEYQCDRCGHRLEVLQRVSEAALTECPDCGEAALRKLVSAAGFILKGTGWYVTDFRDKDKKKEPKKDGDGGQEGKTEKAEKKDGGEGGGTGAKTDAA